MKNNATAMCFECARTGILTATLVFNSETKQREVAVHVCEHPSHKKPDLAWRNVEAIQKTTGLKVRVINDPMRLFSWGDEEVAAVSAA